VFFDYAGFFGVDGIAASVVLRALVFFDVVGIFRCGEVIPES
jgi:hypothetical protein